MRDSTRALVGWTRGQSGLGYADEHFSPISDLDLEGIARRLGCLLRVAPLQEGVQELALPGIVGPPTITVNRHLPAPARRLALRHGLAHLVAGELEGEYDSGPRFMSSVHDYMALEERRADLFALVDLIPDRELEAAVRAHHSPVSARWWMEGQIQQFAADWPKDRLEDRARLRWELYFDQGTRPA
ncbi:MAG: hypothetical protein IPK12_23390 [Gemmatimonadetes bacterium]|nr:hypothetical protein [Gemmatimonadota bacterium]